MRPIVRQLTTSIFTIAALATLLAEVGRAQRVSCEGFEFYRDSTGHMIALHMARSESGEWSLTHARHDRIGANRAKSISDLGDGLVVPDPPDAAPHRTLFVTVGPTSGSKCSISEAQGAL